MGELSTYSIETDQTVLLAFADGRRLRVHVSRLSRYLGPRDLEKVRAALRLRRDFIRKHMPKAVLVLAAGGLIALLAVGGKVVATLMQPIHTPPPHTVIVRSQTLPEPSMSPAPEPTPAATGEATVAAVPAAPPRPAGKPRRTTALITKAAVVPVTPATGATPAPSPAPSPSPSPAPIADSNPAPSNDQTAPSPTPTPIPNQGEVLGDSTGPDSP